MYATPRRRGAEWRTSALGKGPAIAMGQHPSQGVCGLGECKPNWDLHSAGACSRCNRHRCLGNPDERRGSSHRAYLYPSPLHAHSVETLSLAMLRRQESLLARFIAQVDAAFVKELTSWS